jgi:hypothetical protein
MTSDLRCKLDYTLPDFSPQKYFIEMGFPEPTEHRKVNVSVANANGVGMAGTTA